MADQAEITFVRNFINTLGSQPVTFNNDFQQPPEHTLSRVAVLKVRSRVITVADVYIFEADADTSSSTIFLLLTRTTTLILDCDDYYTTTTVISGIKVPVPQPPEQKAGDSSSSPSAGTSPHFTHDHKTRVQQLYDWSPIQTSSHHLLSPTLYVHT